MDDEKGTSMKNVSFAQNLTWLLCLFILVWSFVKEPYCSFLQKATAKMNHENLNLPPCTKISRSLDP